MIKLAEVILVKRVFKILLSGLIAITLVSCFKNENKNIIYSFFILYLESLI